jgi:hypothetical protein
MLAETVMRHVIDFFNSVPWSIIQVLLNWIACYAFWRIGRTRGWLDAMRQENRMLATQHALIMRLHHTLIVGQAHMENLRKRLAEAKQ